MDALVSGLLQALATQATREFALLWGLEDKMQALQGDLRMIQAVIMDAEEKEYEERSVKVWLQDLKDVAYDAIDVFDELNMEATLHPELLNGVDSGVTIQSIRLLSTCFLSCFTLTPNPIPVRHQMGNRIQEITGRLSRLGERRHELLGLIGQRKQSEPSSKRETSSILDRELPMIGRDEHKQHLLEMLCGPDDDCVPRLVPIIGLGGIGKTTLAQAVYNDDLVKEHFHLRKWVFVGENFDARKTIEELLSESAKQRTVDKIPTLEDLHVHLISEIKDKRFLIVLDDIWSNKSEEWDPIWRPLKYGGKGSKVLMTTRLEEVAMVRGPVPFSLRMQPLTDDDCWSIFEKSAFVGGKSEGYPVLKGIGMEIVKRLKGIPLAAKLVGGALIRNFTETYWKRLMDSEIWLQELNEQGVLPSLLLSYQALPSHLKPCFQFCSLFPKDHKFDRETLVWMWMAHDFVQPVGGERMEDVGDRYFDELLDRSFFQCIDNSYVMHDLIHDLAEFVSKDECLRVEDMQKSCSRPGSIHHLSLYLDKDQELEPKDLYQFNRVRTLSCFRGRLSITSRLFGQLRCIRVLDLHGCWRVKSLPKCISDLKHLRYLDIRETWVMKLPESLCTLYNLQTLRVCDDCRLPRGMSKLVNLRNLQAGKYAISGISGIGKLTCLHELRVAFKVSKKKKGHRIGELKGMNQLRGTLGIQNLDRVANAEEAAGFQLRGKVFLDRLELMWDGRDHGQSNVEQVIEALQPPQQLKGVKLGGYPGPRAPSWMTQDPPLLSNLASVDLCDCKNWRCLPSELGRLPCLRSLGIEGMDGVTQVGPEFHCCRGAVLFPCLEELRLSYMRGWEGWVGRGAEVEQCFFCFPPLRKLQIQDCPKLTTISGLLGSHRLESLEQLIIRKCEELERLLRDGEEEGEQNPHSPHSCHLRMVQGIFTAECPKLPWSELESILTLTSSSLRALCVHVSSSIFNSYGNWEDVLAKSNTTTTVAAAAKGMALEYLDTDTRELLSWLLQPGRSLGSLTRLVIEECKELTVFTEEEEDGWLRNLPSLRVLTCEGCANLRCFPAGLHRLSSLQQLHVIRCDQIQALPEHLSSLQRLHIESCNQIQTLPEHLASLQEMRISSCPKLRALPVTPSLQEMRIWSCPKLRALRVTPSLRRMYISGCPLLEEVTWLEMEDSIAPAPTPPHPPPPVQLESVVTDNRRLLSWLLLQPRSLHALQTLRIDSCQELESFTEEETVGWRRNLPSLQWVGFWDCPKLRSLPEGLHITPEIYECPKLGRSCRCFPTWFRN